MFTFAFYTFEDNNALATLHKLSDERFQYAPEAMKAMEDAAYVYTRNTSNYYASDGDKIWIRDLSRNDKIVAMFKLVDWSINEDDD